MRAVPTARGIRLVSTGGTKLAAWRKACTTEAAHAATQHGAFDTPVQVCVVFAFLPPATRKRKVERAGWLWKVTAPDLDKLQRALGDSLTAAGLVADDRLIVSWQAYKIEADWSGALVTIEPALTTPPAI